MPVLGNAKARNMTDEKPIRKEMSPSDSWNEWDVAIYLTVHGRSAKEADELVTMFCNEVKDKLGDRLVVKAVETDK
jgi:hypothetical protein